MNTPHFPKLRDDLLVRKTGKEICELKVPDSEAVCLLYEFELSLARKMDGNRDLDALVEKGRTLGLPMTREQMASFVRQLACYHFIEGEPGIDGALQSTLVDPAKTRALVEEEKSLLARDLEHTVVGTGKAQVLLQLERLRGVPKRLSFWERNQVSLMVIGSLALLTVGWATVLRDGRPSSPEVVPSVESATPVTHAAEPVIEMVAPPTKSVRKATTPRRTGRTAKPLTPSGARSTKE
ncbi:MAG: hypothetical protein ACT4TC_13410 [Myxococcaceae bacterium]